MNLRKILCPIDFSSGSQKAMRVATRLATETGAQLVLFHVWYVPPLAFAADYTFPPDLFQDLVDSASKGLDEARREVTALGAKDVSSKLANGLPWTMIVGELEDPTYDLVVVGTHGRTGLSRILIGSVAEKVVRHAPCSVLAVRPHGEAQPFTNILCPTDFSASSQQATDLAVELVAPGGKGITLLHVVEVPVAFSGESAVEGFIRDLDKHADKLLDTWAARLRVKTTAPITTRARIGNPGAQTLEVLDHDSTIDLVVMGSHGRTGISRALLGSVAEKVVRHARCPVLVARKRS
jgi:nucleotide-binding universal stress UspA family protein